MERIQSFTRALTLGILTAAMLAAVLMLADTAPAGAVDDEPLPAALKVNMACSPLTSSQKPAGTTQTCLIRVINTGQLAASDVIATKVGGWTVTGVSAYGKLSGAALPGITCAPDGSPSCTITSLPGGGRFYVAVNAVKPQAQDGFGRAYACTSATGIAQKCAQEAASLP